MSVNDVNLDLLGQSPVTQRIPTWQIAPPKDVDGRFLLDDLSWVFYLVRGISVITSAAGHNCPCAMNTAAKPILDGFFCSSFWKGTFHG